MGHTLIKACYPEETLNTGFKIFLWDPFLVPSLALFLFSFLASSLQSSIFYFFFLLLQQHTQQRAWMISSIFSPPPQTKSNTHSSLVRSNFVFYAQLAYIDVTKQIRVELLQNEIKFDDMWSNHFVFLYQCQYVIYIQQFYESLTLK